MKYLLIILALLVVGCADTTQEEKQPYSFEQYLKDNNISLDSIEGSTPEFEYKFTSEGTKAIQCQEVGKVRPDDGLEIWETPSDIFFWYVVDFDTKEIFYTHEFFHREQSRSDITDGNIDGIFYELTYDAENLYGNEEGREYPTVEIDRVNLKPLHRAPPEEKINGSLLRHFLIYQNKCELLTAQEYMDAILREKDSDPRQI